MGGTKVLRMVLSQKDLYGVLPNAVGAMRRLDSSLNMNYLNGLFSLLIQIGKKNNPHYVTVVGRMKA
jgi:hypothetical protein